MLRCRRQPFSLARGFQMRKLALLLTVLATLQARAAVPDVTSATTGELSVGSVVTLEGTDFGDSTAIWRFMDCEGSIPIGTAIPNYKQAEDSRFPSGFRRGPNSSNSDNSPLTNAYRLTDTRVHAGHRALVASIRRGMSQPEAILAYLPELDTTSPAAPNSVFLSWWQYNDFMHDPNAGSNHTMHKVSSFSNSTNLDIMQNYQEGDVSWTEFAKEDANGDWYIDWANEFRLDANDENQGQCGCYGDSEATCNGDPCSDHTNIQALPGPPTSDWDGYKFNHLWASGNTHGNGTDPTMYAPGHHWTRYDFFIQASSDTTVRDGSFELRISNSATAVPVIYRWDSNIVTHWEEDSIVLDESDQNPNIPGVQPEVRVNASWPSPGEYKNIFLYNMWGHDSWGKADFYVDDMYVGMAYDGDSARQRVELGNAPYLSSCTKWEIQPITTWSDTEITFALRAGSYTGQDCYWVYVFDGAGNANEEGMKITIGVVPPGPGPGPVGGTRIRDNCVECDGSGPE